MKRFKVEWTHEPVSLTDEQQKKLSIEIDEISECLEAASDLIFHTVVLGSIADGPIVMIDGHEENPDTLFLTYYETANWVPMSFDEENS